MSADPGAGRRRRVGPVRAALVAALALIGSVSLVGLVGLVGPTTPASAAPASADQVALLASVHASGPSSRPATARVAGELPVPTQDPQTSNQKADDILSRSEFQEAQPGIYDRVVGAIGDALGSLLSGLFVGGVGSALAWVILAAAVALIAVLVFRVGRTVRPDPSRPDVPLQVEVRRSPVEWRREAEAFEARGEWKSALRCRYRALVADLVSRKVVRDQPGHTTGEYRADVSRALPDVSAEFGGASELFERAWYGDRPTGPDENARFRELAEVVVDGAGTRSRSHADGDAATAGAGPHEGLR